MSVIVDLGNVQMTDPLAKARLDGKVQVMLNSRESIRNQTLSSTLEEHLLHGNSWVRRGLGFHLSITIVVDGQPWPIDENKLLQESLVEAELWRQLKLHASMPELSMLYGSSYVTEEDGIMINLDDNRRSAHTPNIANHKILQDVPFADVQPPPGIDTIEMTSIKFAINITQLSRTQRKRKRPGISPKAQQEPSIGFHADSKSSAALDIQQGDYLQDSVTIDGHHIVFSHIDSVLFDETQYSAFESSQVHDMISKSDVSETESQFDSGTKSMDKGECLFTEPKGAKCQRTVVWRLVEAAIRLAIGGQPLQSSFGIKTTCSLGHKCLSFIAPALFNPGYLHAVAQRSVFIPTISYALMHGMMRNTQSHLLKEKILHLASDRPNHKQEGIADSYMSGDSFNSDLWYECGSKHLWKFIQRTLYDAKAARKLQPLDILAQASTRTTAVSNKKTAVIGTRDELDKFNTGCRIGLEMEDCNLFDHGWSDTSTESDFEYQTGEEEEEEEEEASFPSLFGGPGEKLTHHDAQHEDNSSILKNRESPMLFEQYSNTF